MGRPQLLPQLLLLASLQAGEWVSSLDLPGAWGSPGRAVTCIWSRGTAGEAGQAPTPTLKGLGHPNPSPSSHPKPGEGDTQARGPVLPCVTLVPVVRVPDRLGLSSRLSKASKSLSPSSRQLSQIQ